jgi:hypothetical protein
VAASQTSKEQVVLSADRHRPNRAFQVARVELDAAVFEESREFGLSARGVRDRLGHVLRT